MRALLAAGKARAGRGRMAGTGLYRVAPVFDFRDDKARVLGFIFTAMDRQ